MHDYEPYSDEELDDLLEDGDYPFEIMEYHYLDKNGNRIVSGKGVPMVKIKICIFADRPREILDFILLNKQWAFKYKHLCDSIGRVTEYMEKKLKPDFFPGAKGYVSIGRQPAKDGYRAKNNVLDYVKKADQPDGIISQTAPKTAPATSIEDFNDDLPF